MDLFSYEEVEIEIAHWLFVMDCTDHSADTLSLVTEKKLVLDMIRAVSVSDHEFREGFNEMIRPPVYDDQLLQQESSLDVDEIQKYNDMKRREKEVEAEEDRKKKEQDDSYQKPK